MWESTVDRRISSQADISVPKYTDSHEASIGHFHTRTNVTNTSYRQALRIRLPSSGLTAERNNLVTSGLLPAETGEESTLLSHRLAKDVRVGVDLLIRGSDGLTSHSTLANGGVLHVGQKADSTEQRYC